MSPDDPGGVAGSGSSDRVTAERLLAVQRALDPSRVTEEVDILLDSVVVALSNEGALAEDALVAHVCAMWPGAKLQRDRVLRAIRAGVQARLLVEQPTLSDDPGYALLADASPRSDLRDRVEATLESAAQGVRARFHAELARDLEPEEASQLTTALVDALAAGIREAFSIFEGDVRQITKDTLLPSSWDKAAITRALDSYDFDEATREVMDALALSALDPGSNFGSDIVSQIATGYILHAFIARRDQAGAIEQVGVLAGVNVLLDTPVLLELTGKTANAESLVATIRAAKKANLTVIVPQHCLEELSKLLSALEQGGAVETIKRGLAEGTDPYYLAQTVDHTALQAWLSHSEEGKVVSWEQYYQRATALDQPLRNLGCNTMHLPDTGEARRLHDSMKSHMNWVLTERPRSGQDAGGPNRDAVDVDAATLAMSAQLRGRAAADRFWPRCWVLTPDRRMSDAYARYATDDEFSITMQPAQLAALLATFVTPAAAGQLATAAAKMLSHDTLLQVASRYPAEVAAKVAAALRSDGASSEVDLRLMQQTSIDELLDGIEPSPDHLPDHVAAQVIERQARRRQLIAANEVARARASEEAARQRQEATQVSWDAEKEATRRAAEEERQRQSSERQQLEEQLQAERLARSQQEERASAEADRARTYKRRGALAVASTVLVAVAVGLYVLAGLVGFAVGTGLTAIALFLFGWSWAEELEVPWNKFARTMLFELIGVFDLFA